MARRKELDYSFSQKEKVFIERCMSQNGTITISILVKHLYISEERAQSLVDCLPISGEPIRIPCYRKSGGCTKRKVREDMPRPLKKYVEDKTINSIIHAALKEWGCCSTGYLQRKTKMSYDACVEMLKDVPKRPRQVIDNFK